MGRPIELPSEAPPQRLRARDMLEAGDRQAGELFQPVGVDRRARRHVLLDKGRQRGRLEVWDHRQSHAAGCRPAFLDSGQDQGGSATLQLATAAQPRRPEELSRISRLGLSLLRAPSAQKGSSGNVNEPAQRTLRDGSPRERITDPGRSGPRTVAPNVADRASVAEKTILQRADLGDQ